MKAWGISIYPPILSIWLTRLKQREKDSPKQVLGAIPLVNHLPKAHNHFMSQVRSRRSIRLVRSPQEDGVGVFCIAEKDLLNYYTFCEIPCEIGGRGFAVHKTGIGNLYYVRIGEPEDCSCECLGFLDHGYCRHILGLLALEKKGLL